ncbi:hypothetical protein [Nonomuraea jiangxiensis]|uniref:Uncharacterized protein n=1 Tax=Nonomuraea jiangxiensis TaxID=633440 RepID=A0A1G8BI01_9ACTN|nr:hypothetical protein [Nonomuraea jiangxiensis]SDH32872.1 hypothetical protein SAMN05421869_10241 [Nonomuraea jiangxiensis]
MIAVVVSLVAVVLLVLVVVALGMRSMNRRESSLPPERLKEMAEKEEQTMARSTDEFAAHEPRMANFSPDFSPIDEPKPKPVRTGQRGRRGVDEWGNPTSDSDDEEFWASIRSDAEEGGFGAGGTVAARKGASRPVERERPAEQQRPEQRRTEQQRTEQRPAAQRPEQQRPEQRPAEQRPADQRPAEQRPEQQRPEQQRPAAQRPAGGRPERPKRRSERSKPKPATASVDPDATTVQGPLPPRPAAANLADLVEPVKRATPGQSELADQRTVTFAAPTGDVMSILGAGAQPVPAPTRPADQAPAKRPDPVSTNSPYPAAAVGGSYPASGSFPATPAATGSGSFPAVSPTSSGSFPAAPAPIHGAPTSDPFPAYSGVADPLDTTWAGQPAATSSGSWPATPDILDDPTPAAPSYGSANSWPAFDQSPSGSFPASYEVRSGWAVADDSDPLTGPSPATGTPTTPSRAVSSYDDVLSAPVPPSSFAYETGDYTNPATGNGSAAAWPEPPSSAAGWPTYGNQPQQNGNGGHRPAPEQDYPHDYYR